MDDPDVSSLPQISDAEWRVMRIAWKLGEATTAQVITELDGKASWKPKTVQTLIGRLVQKGALTFEKNGREYLYRPAVEEKVCTREASRTFLDRVFDGKLAPFIANFVENRDYTSGELEELKRILEEKSNGSDC